MSNTRDSPVLIAGDAHPDLTDRIGRELRVSVDQAEVATFADGETRIHIAADLRGAQVVIVQPTGPPVNDHLVALGLLADAATAAGAARVIGVVPYFGYSRQERRPAVGDPRSARLAARFLGAAGIHQLVTLDLHAPALESAFPMPVTLLEPDELFLPLIRNWTVESPLIVAPDAGGMKRAQRIARALEAEPAALAKHREAPDAASALRILGEVRGRECVIVDDMASTGRTLTDAAELLADAGAESVDAVFTHAVMAEGALERLTSAPLRRLATTDSIPLGEAARDVLEVIAVAPLLADAVRDLTGGEASDQ